MEKTYIFGHQKPDTDSVCASIALSYLKNELGFNTMPKVLGHINNETKFVLSYFGVKEPEYLNDVKVQVRNMKYNKNAIIDESSSIQDAFLLMQQEEETGVCVVDENKKLKGLVTLKELAKQWINGEKEKLNTSLENIVKVLEAEVLLAFRSEINGKIFTATYQSKTIIENVKLNEENIMVVGDRYKVLKYAIATKVQLIVITGGHEIDAELLKKAKENKVSIIRTKLDTFHVANQLTLSNYSSTILTDTDPVTVNSLDYRTDFLELCEKLGYSNYPIVNKKGKCLGLLKTDDMNQYEKLHVILVDHNGFSQSVDGIEEAIVDEIIDHHNLVNVGTSVPINFRSMPVGSTCTIIYHMYKEHGVKIPKEMAGLMLSAILSDTLLLRSVTTTDIDKKVVENLAKIAKVDISRYGHEMVKSGFSIKGKKAEDLLEEDVKTFRIDDKVVGISQIFTMDYEDIASDMENFVDKIDALASGKFDIVITLITDIEKNGSYVFYDRKSENLVKDVFDNEVFCQGYFVQDLLSRKKQLVPNVMEVLEK